METDERPVYGPEKPADGVLVRVGVRTLADAEADAQAARLRSQGMSYRQIAQELGIATMTAHRRVQRALAAVVVEAVEELRAIEGIALDELIVKATEELNRPHVLVSHGRIIRDDEGNPMIDHHAWSVAWDRLMKARESRRRLWGLDRPLKIEQTIEMVDVEAQKARAEELLDEVAAKRVQRLA